MKTPALAMILGAILLLSAPGLGQVSVFVPDSSSSTGAACNVIPMGVGSGWTAQTYIGRIPASFLAITAGQQRVNEIYFAPCGSGVWTCSSIVIGIGHVPTPLPGTFNFPVGANIGSFLDFTVLWDSAIQGPFTWTATANTWSPLGFAGQGGTAFCWNGQNDIAFFITQNNATISPAGWGGDCYRSATEPYRMYNVGQYNALTSNGGGANGLKMQLDFVACGPVTPLFETNDAASSLNFNGIQGNAFIRARTNVCTGSMVNANSGSTSVGLPWEVGFNFSALVPATNPGAFNTPGGQIVNLDLTAGLFFLFGGVAPAPIPFPGSFSAAFAAPGAAGTLSMQQLNGNPAHPDGVSLSQGCELVFTGNTLPSTPVAGPTCDDCDVQVPVGCLTGLYGRTYATLFIESNGRLMFGGGNVSLSPSASQFASDAPSFGVWTDWNPAAGGSVTLTQPVPGLIRVNYTGIPYYGTTTSNTFALLLDTATGIVSIDGLLGVVAGTQQMLIGISGGNAVGATDPGMVNYSPATTIGGTFNATDMIYRIATGGSVTSGVNRIDFYPNAYQNYDWITS